MTPRAHTTEGARPIPPMLIALPQGLNVSGVTTWAVRLANGLVARGARVGMILHPEPDGHAPIDMPIDQRVCRYDLRHLPRIERSAGDLTPYIKAYLDAVCELGENGSQGPVVVSPNQHGDCYGVVAAIALAEPSRVRVVGWQHTDIVYDTQLLRHFAPMLERAVGVSDLICEKIRAALGERAGDVRNIPYGVEIPEACPAREAPGARPVRLLYPGRLEHEQKRIRALIEMARELDNRGVDYTLTFLGDGPAASEIDSACAANPRLTRVPPGGPADVRSALRKHDAFVLASRYEGLSIAMLEALAQGCPPIVAAVESGVTQAIDDGVTGVLARTTPDADPRSAGRAMADAVERAIEIGLAGLGARAWRSARDRFSVDRHVDTVAQMLGEIADAPARPWPATRPCAFSAGAGGSSGSLPEHGRARMASVLRKLAGERVVLHGAGRHTIELADTLASAPCEIVAICDDDPNRHGQRLLGWEIIAPGRAGEYGARHAIISTWMHEQQVLARRSVYESQGVRVHPIYSEDAGSNGASQSGAGDPGAMVA